MIKDLNMAALVRPLFVFIVCELFALVSGASTPSTSESGPWCILVMSPQSAGSMECKFSEEVQFIQVDFYLFGSEGPPVIAVSCDQSNCEPNTNFSDMLKVRGSPSKQSLTVEVHGVSEAHAGKYRCQAQSIASSLTEEGICSFQYPTPAHEITTESPAAKKESDILYVLLVLLVLPIAALVVLLLCICKRKSLGPWKKQDSPLDDTVGPTIGAGQRLSYPEAEPLVTFTKDGVADKSLSAGQKGDGEGNAREEKSRIILDDGKDTGDNERQSVGENVVTSTGEASATAYDAIANNRDGVNVGDVSHAHRSENDVVRLPTCETNEDNEDISLNALRRQFE